MNKEIAYDLQTNIDNIIEDLDTISKIHTRLDELSEQLSDVVYLASIPTWDISVKKTSTGLMQLVKELLNRVELGINALEHRVSTIEDIRSRLRAHDVET